MSIPIKPKTILLSLANKTGLEDFVHSLASLYPEIEIIASDGTFDYIKKNCEKSVLETLRLTRIASVIGESYSSSKRVRSLGFSLYTAILEPSPKELCIDVVYCDVYDFHAIQSTAQSEETIIEGIDIGGITMLRAAAKNCKRVLAITNAQQKEGFLEELRESSTISFETRVRHAAEIFSHTADYDRRIANYFTQYSQAHEDSESAKIPLPQSIDLSFHYDNGSKTLRFAKQLVHGQELRYGDNPDQVAGLYTLRHGSASLSRSGADAAHGVFSAIKQLKQGKQCSKTNISDIDAALHILRNFTDKACAVIVKHGNPCGVALGASHGEAVLRAWNADRIAAFGGLVVVNRPFTDEDIAKELSSAFFDAIVAPSFSKSVVTLLEKQKSLSLYELPRFATLEPMVKSFDLRTCSDGSIILQDAFFPNSSYAWKKARYSGKKGVYEIVRSPTESELEDLWFGWCIQAGTMSNSILFVKDSCTISIAAGEQDRVGAASIARDKAYRNKRAFLSLQHFQAPYDALEDTKQHEIESLLSENNAGLRGSAMISDGFFPFRDGADVGLDEGVAAILQPGGSIRDYEVINACNEHKATMLFSAQRSFRH